MLADTESAKQLLEVAAVMVYCRQAVPTEDVPAKIVNRVQCLARCAEDLLREVVDSIPSDGRACGWCGKPT